MKAMRRLAARLVILLLLCGSLPALAATPAETAPDPAASTLVDTFDNACLGYLGRPARLRVWLDAHYRMAEHDSEEYFLHGHPGKVWFRTTLTGRFVVVLFGDGVCSVKAQKASANDTYRLLQARVAALGFTLGLAHDEKREVAKNVTMQLHSYKLHKDDLNFMLEADGTDASAVPIQMSLALQPDPSLGKFK